MFLDPNAKSQSDAHMQKIEHYCRMTVKESHELPEWKLFQRAYTEGKIRFIDYFITTMSGHYYHSPSVQDTVRSH